MFRNGEEGDGEGFVLAYLFGSYRDGEIHACRAVISPKEGKKGGPVIVGYLIPPPSHVQVKKR
jgi:hypothetical protein